MQKGRMSGLIPRENSGFIHCKNIPEILLPGSEQSDTLNVFSWTVTFIPPNIEKLLLTGLPFPFEGIQSLHLSPCPSDFMLLIF